MIKIMKKEIFELPFLSFALSNITQKPRISYREVSEIFLNAEYTLNNYLRVKNSCMNLNRTCVYLIKFLFLTD